jgi:integrase|uniref:Site-specific integrase n=1 Tax=Meiothermus ruber TaxID=277 RepID=A0A7C3HUD2_MEIRU
MGRLLEDFLAEQAYRGNSPKTLGWYRKVFAVLGAEPEQLDRSRMVGFIGECRARGLSPATVRNYDRAVRVVVRWGVRRGYLKQDPLEGLPPPREKAEPVRPYRPEEIERLWAVASRSRRPRRERALLAVALDTGLRLGELCRLTLDDIDWRNGTLRVKGKTGVRVVPISGKALSYLNAYINRERKAYDPIERRVFLSLGGRGFREESLYCVFRRIARSAGVKGGPHRLRHTAAVTMLKAGGDIFTVGRVLGHSRLETTKGYLALMDGDIKAIHEKISPLSRLGL